jgi:hypothetical protein
MSEAEIEAYNRRDLWRDAANHLTIAAECIEQAQSALEDLGRVDYADQLEDHRNALRRAGTEALEQAGEP